MPQEPYYLWGIAYFNGNLWATDSVNIYELNPTNGAVIQEFDNVFPSGNVTGLTADPDNGMLYAVSQFNELYEIDPDHRRDRQLGARQRSGLERARHGLRRRPADRLRHQRAGLRGRHQRTRRVRSQHARLCSRVPVPYTGFVSGLGGDGLGGVNADWYSFNVNAGDNLVDHDHDARRASASGLQFANDLDPTINLYDASGNLVATATGNAPDGRNDVIDWTALTPGSYRLQIMGASKTNLGEYTISIQGATGGLAPFTVTSTNPAAGSDIGYQVSTHGRDLQQQRPALEHQRQRLHDRRQRRHRLHPRSTPTR